MDCPKPEILLLAEELVSVKPVGLPTGKLYYMDYIYGFERVKYYDRDEYDAYTKELDEYLNKMN